MPAHVLIAGGGIGGLVTALTLHQIGVPCTVFESTREFKPLGVGLNLQPNAVRELLDLGVTLQQLETVGTPAREWALLGRNGALIHAEPRGLDAGYQWPQFAVHRGRFHMLLYQLVCERLGDQAICLDQKACGFHQDSDGVTLRLEDRTGNSHEAHGQLLIGAEGIHSKIRALIYPDQPDIRWGGVIMWRGTARARPFRTGASFVGLGTHQHRVVIYPISAPDAQGMAEVNWIAERKLEPDTRWQETGWFRPVETSEFAHFFNQFTFDWLNVPALLASADMAFENPMIDRDPIPSWVQGRVGLLGDAAHAMYPTGSNGASQAIMDARVLGAKFLRHGVTPEALSAYDAQLCQPISELVLRNRGNGPFGLLDLVDARCGGVFEQIDDIVPRAEREAFLADYKTAAGFAKEALNAAPSTVPAGARLT